MIYFACREKLTSKASLFFRGKRLDTFRFFRFNTRRGEFFVSKIRERKERGGAGQEGREDVAN